MADITQHWTLEGWLHLAVVIDAHSRPVVDWTMGERINTDLVVNALEMALHNRQPDAGVIHHSDQGAQHTALSFGKHLEASGVMGNGTLSAAPWRTPWPKASLPACRQNS